MSVRWVERGGGSSEMFSTVQQYTVTTEEKLRPDENVNVR